ncbi:hypothetical protein WS73_25580 [Burkholderia savannae]|nr:hypothetical protein WS73_25580 [Burkholderia savannae]
MWLRARPHTLDFERAPTGATGRLNRTPAPKRDAARLESAMKAFRQIFDAIQAETVEPVSARIGIPVKTDVTATFDWISGYLDAHPEFVVKLYIHRANPKFESISALVTKKSMAQAKRSGDFQLLLTSFGGAGQGSLPGVARFVLRTYECPECHRQVDIIPLDGVPPPKCQNGHSPREMEVAAGSPA